VVLREPGSTAVTDPMGRYLFRDLAAGSYTISIQSDAQTAPRTVRLGARPVDLTNVDFHIGPSSPPDVAAPIVTPPQPESRLATPISAVPGPAIAQIIPPSHPAAPAAPVLLAETRHPAVEIAASRSAAAQQHNILGRQLTKAGRYREAIAELTGAIRIAPDFAMAYNARGFARVMLRDWDRALEDLDKAILLNPGYADAYRIRAVARRAIGDTQGAAADSKKSQQVFR
jgi:tetratricopeptide (TPR) repeat protein